MHRSRAEIGKGHLASQLKSALAEDSRLNVLDLEVHIIEATVHLTGHVPSEELKRTAEIIVREVCEGMPIDNRLQVSEPAHAPSHEQL